MFKRLTILNTNVYELSNYSDGIDIYDAKILKVLKNYKGPKELYKITLYQYRPDLISKDFYGSEDYMGFVILLACRVLTNFNIGSSIELIPKAQLDILLQLII